MTGVDSDRAKVEVRRELPREVKLLLAAPQRARRTAGACTCAAPAAAAARATLAVLVLLASLALQQEEQLREDLKLEVGRPSAPPAPRLRAQLLRLVRPKRLHAAQQRGQ